MPRALFALCAAAAIGCADGLAAMNRVGVVFDIDGTLVSTGGAGMKAFGEAFEAAFGVGDVTGKIKFAGRTDYSLFREMCRHGGIDCTAETRDTFFSHYLRLVDGHLDANTGCLL